MTSDVQTYGLPNATNETDTLPASFINISVLLPIDHHGLNSNDSSAAGQSCLNYWSRPNHVVYQVAHVAIFLAYCAPNTIKGLVFLHAALVIGFLLLASWAWAVLCAPDVFSWGFSFCVINAFQVVFLLYQLRPVRFSSELEDLYAGLFQPMKITRSLFKKLVSSDNCMIQTLNQGECYAHQEVTKTDRLSLLISGTAHVTSHGQFLHYIQEKQFLDSPEFESCSHGEEKFHVSIIAGGPCSYLCWQRTSLEYLFAQEPYLATVMGHILGRDITNKLYLLNEKLRINNGARVDIRLPNVSSAALSGVDLHIARGTKQDVPSLTPLEYSDAEDSEDYLDEVSEKMPMFPNGIPHSRLQLQLSSSTYSSVSSR